MGSEQNAERGKDVIYILLSIEKKTFFIARGAENTLQETYRHNLKGRRERTKDFIESLAPERPCLFILERIEPNEKAYLLLVWLRILTDNGFKSVNHPDIIEQSQHLYIDNQIAYEKRKSTDLSELLSCANCLIPRYKNVTCPQYPHEEGVCNTEYFISKKSRKCDKVIRIRLSEAEYKCITDNAKKMGMGVKPYLRAIAQNRTVIRFDCQTMLNHTKEIGEIRTALNRIAHAIVNSNNYLPSEFKITAEYMEEIFKMENEILRTFGKQQDRMEELRRQGKI